MSTDYAEKEREFLATLEQDTGRSLAQWMAVISAEKLADKNDVIDWLRGQGFMFWKASWIERIHSNGGRPIYAGTAPAARPEAAPPSDATPVSPQPSPPAAMPAPELVMPSCVVEPPAPLAPAAAPSTNLPAIDELVARGKALAPLARHLMREIRRNAPDCEILPSQNTLVFRNRREFAVLAIGPKELKLGLALGPAPVSSPFVTARFPAPAYAVPAGLTHMIGLADVRQAGPEVVDAIRKAAALASL